MAVTRCSIHLLLLQAVNEIFFEHYQHLSLGTELGARIVDRGRLFSLTFGLGVGCWAWACS